MTFSEVVIADQCAHGELGKLLRRENLYSNQLRDWRKQLESGGETALSKSAPGPKAAKTPEQKRIEQLEKELARTKHRLQITEDCVGIQKKCYRCSISRTLGTIHHDRPGAPPTLCAVEHGL